MSKITIARCLVATIGSPSVTTVAERVEDIRDAVGGFTLTGDAGAYVVSDGRDSSETADAAEALRTYAEYIETFVDDFDPWRGYVWTTGGLNDNGTYEVDSDGYAETADEARTEIAEWVGRTARFYVLVTDHVEVESRIERRNLSREDAIAYARRFADDFAARRGAQVSEHHGGLEIGIETADGDELGYVEVIRHGSAYGAAGVLA